MRKGEKITRTCGLCLLKVRRPCQNYIEAANCQIWRRAKKENR